MGAAVVRCNRPFLTVRTLQKAGSVFAVIVLIAVTLVCAHSLATPALPCACPLCLPSWFSLYMSFLFPRAISSALPLLSLKNCIFMNVSRLSGHQTGIVASLGLAVFPTFHFGIQ